MDEGWTVHHVSPLLILRVVTQKRYLEGVAERTVAGKIVHPPSHIPQRLPPCCLVRSTALWLTVSSSGRTC